MKKVIALLLTVICLLTLPGCQSGGQESFSTGPDTQSDTPSEGETGGDDGLRVLVDLGICRTYIRTEQQRDKTLEQFKKDIKELGGPTDIEFECIYYDYRAERKSENASLRHSELTRVRTEIMAGKGPDVFIAACDNHANLEREEALFKYPEQTLDRRMFLPLDKYIENAQFMEWDKLQPAVMAAGKNEDGQQLLLLTYSMPLSIFRKSEFPHQHSKTMTFEEMAKEDYPVQLLSTRRKLESAGRETIMDYDHLAAVFAQIADYETEELTFTEEELLEVMNTIGELDKRREQGAFRDVPAYYQENLGVNFDVALKFADTAEQNHPEDLEHTMGMRSGEALSLVPTYTVEGGYGAVITSFAGINRNTERPEDAFFVLDYLLSKEGQQSPIYINMTPQASIPTHGDVMKSRTKVTNGDQKQQTSLGGYRWQTWSLPKSNFDELCDLRDNITHVRFRTELDGKLADLLDRSGMLYGNDEAMKREAHSTYMEMQMMLAES